MVYIYTPSPGSILEISSQFFFLMLLKSPAQLSHPCFHCWDCFGREEISPQSRMVFRPGFDPWREVESSGDSKTFKRDYYSCLAVNEPSVSDKNLLQWHVHRVELHAVESRTTRSQTCPMAIYCSTRAKAAETKVFREIIPIKHVMYLWMSYLWLNKVCPSGGCPTWAYILGAEL